MVKRDKPLRARREAVSLSLSRAEENRKGHPPNDGDDDASVVDESPD